MTTRDEPDTELIEQAQACAHLSLLDASALRPDIGPGFPLLRVQNQACEGLIAPQGAQLLSAVIDGEDLLWLSPQAVFAEGRAIRGGVPVCLPWFGVNQRDPSLPRHGFARVSSWRLERAAAQSDELTELFFSLGQFDQRPHPLFPFPFRARLRMRLGARLSLALEVENTGTEPMPLSWALHSYHAVRDIQDTTVSGLADCVYLDNTRGLERASQDGEVGFDGELDRAYLQVPGQQLIHGDRELAVSGDNCASAIVWNPGAKLAATIADIGIEYRRFVCVERGNAFDDALVLEPGGRHCGQVAFGFSA